MAGSEQGSGISASVMIVDDLMFFPEPTINDLIAIRDVLDIPIIGMLGEIVSDYEDRGEFPFAPVVEKMVYRIPEELPETAIFLEGKKGRRRGQRQQNRSWQ